MRVVITGLGLVTSVGVSAASTWDGILTGRSGVSRVDRFDTSRYRVHVAHLIRSLPAITGHQLSRMVARQALDDSRLDVAGDAGRVGVALGTLGGDLRGFERRLAASSRDLEESIEPELAVSCPPETFATHAADEVGALGPRVTFLTACSSGSHALAYACELLAADEADAMVVAGVHLFSQTEFTYFHNLRALAPDRCRPFDRTRRGLLIGEGAGALVVERVSRARKRGALAYAEILGLGMTCDGYHVTSPQPSGDGAVRAMRRALKSAQLVSGDIDFVSAHGTGTFVNDPIECRALREIFGSAASRLPVSSVKSTVGHTMGASGVIETAICCLAMRTSTIPPTANFQVPDPSCPVDCVPNSPRPAALRYVMKNSFGFGGNNVSLILGRAQ